MAEAERDYSNREINTMFAHIKEQLDRIESQTIKHNGRMSKLENWRAYVSGAVAFAIVLGIPNIIKIAQML